MSKSKKVVDATKNEEENVQTENVQTATAPKEPVIESAKLTELKNAKSAAMAEIAKMEPGSEMEDKMMEVWKLNSEIKTEEAKIKSDIAEAAKQEKLNERRKLVDDFESAVLSGDADEIAKTKEVLYNLAIAGIAHTKATTRKSVSGNSTGTRGAIAAAIRELIVPLYASGTDGKEVRRIVIHDNGFNDGTANAQILAYEKEIGLK